MKNSKQRGFVSVAVITVILLALVGGGIYLNKRNENKFGNNGNDIAKVAPGNVINLSGRNLTKAPDYIFNQKNTVELDLSNNLISGALQSQIQNLQKLKVLNLSNNKFTGVPAEIGQLKKLEVLNLSSNELTGLPNELGNLSNLKLLDLRGNNYSETDLATIRKNLPAQTVIQTDN